MNLRRELTCINDIAYKPVYSGRIQQAPHPFSYTVSHAAQAAGSANATATVTANVTPNPKFTGVSVLSTRGVAAATSRRLLGGVKSRTAVASTSRMQHVTRANTAALIRSAADNGDDNDDTGDDDAQHSERSTTSTNISLLTVGSDQTLPVAQKPYGRFVYSSFFERYMNSRAKVKIRPHRMSSRQPQQPLEILTSTAASDGQMSSGGVELYEMLDAYDRRKLIDMYQIYVAPVRRLRSASVACETPCARREDTALKQPRQRGLPSTTPRPTTTHAAAAATNAAINHTLLALVDMINSNRLRQLAGRRLSLLPLSLPQQQQRQETKKKTGSVTTDTSDVEAMNAATATATFDDILFKHTRENIRGPSVYVLGSLKKKQQQQQLDPTTTTTTTNTNNNNDRSNNSSSFGLHHQQARSQRYDNVKAKISSSRKPQPSTVILTSIASSRHAISRNMLTTATLNNNTVTASIYTAADHKSQPTRRPTAAKSAAASSSAHLMPHVSLQLTDDLYHTISENLRLRKGPVYFAPLTELNVATWLAKTNTTTTDNNNTNNNNKATTTTSKSRVHLTEKFLRIYEWLRTFDTADFDASHMFANPFHVDQFTVTNTRSIDHTEWSDDLVPAAANAASAAAVDDNDEHKSHTATAMLNNKNKKKKIDPFDNPKNVVDRPMKAQLNERLVNGHNVLYETVDKHTYESKRNYTSYLHLGGAAFGGPSVVGGGGERIKKLIASGVEDKRASITSRYNQTAGPLTVAGGAADPLLFNSNSIYNKKARENLVRQQKINDDLQTRLQLDIYII